MASKSNIEWTGHTWNPLAGCSVLTPGCKRCYAMKMAARLEKMGQPLYAGLTKPSKAGPVWTREMRQASDDVLLAPLRRKKPTVYFVNSMSDLFHENVPDEWIDRIFAVMADTERHTHQVLTKRSDRMRRYCSDPETPVRVARWIKGNHRAYASDSDVRVKWPLPNVWKGVSTEDQPRADLRIPELLRTPAAVRFISAEPLLGRIDLTCIKRERPNMAYIDNALDGFISNGFGGCYGPKLDWVIVGGESGRGYRPMAPEWAYSLRDQCVAAGVPVFIKQMAGKKPIPADLMLREFPVAV